MNNQQDRPVPVDVLIDEVRQRRRDLLASCGDDLDALVRLIRQREAEASEAAGKQLRKRTIKKTTNWDLYYQKQMGDPEMRALIEEELKTLRVGTELARLRRKAHMSQTQLAAKTGMSAPTISRIEMSPAQNMTVETLVRIARALGREVEIALPVRRSARKRPGSAKA